MELRQFNSCWGCISSGLFRPLFTATHLMLVKSGTFCAIHTGRVLAEVHMVTVRLVNFLKSASTHIMNVLLVCINIVRCRGKKIFLTHSDKTT